MNKYKTDETFKHIFWITIVYILSQGFLLVASGIWWDDWVYVNKNWDYLLKAMLQQSMPLQAYINASLWLLPDGAYRILVFILFYAGALLAYTIMKKTDVFSSEAAFWITLLYVTVPINDARITWICYGYSLGLLSFWIAFWLVTLWQGKTGKKAVILRILSLIVLIFSFNTESIMLMTLVILLYLYYEKLKDGWKWNEIRSNIVECMKAVLSYIDFLLAPIVYYFGKKPLFPTYGEIYSGYHSIDMEALPQLILHLPVYAWETMLRLLGNYKSAMLKLPILILLIAAACCYILLLFVRRLKRGYSAEDGTQYSSAIKMLLVGIFCFMSGFAPYSILRRGTIVTTGEHGRDTLLLGIGTAMILYYLVNIAFRKEVGKMLLVLFTILGVCHFNLKYLDWQEDYYQQLRFQAEIAENQDILDNDTFLCLDYDYWTNGYTMFYQLNGNSYAVTGEETRYYLMDIKNIGSFMATNEDSWILQACNMRDWDYSPENRHIDGIILFNNELIGNSVQIRLKLKELFNKDAFYEWFKETKDITYIPVTREESDAIVAAYQDGTLTRENIFDYVEAY